ncbi:phosphohistidine phosphatase SixA [Paraglaciecola aquimarina]|uniref:Phosphohistidine phosphatase SixA n=1 Tax=Paraglaciecola aquimarina TaxID=1235557 RepID=A0ABU3SZS1_9ALTE|nr:phosphohistidine phosphatase SixA [Paraglaciecola aquimarina]MDU0355509.1 phosphohistidine phosphatase SixA [Paraglaciecola aquimarina]
MKLIIMRHGEANTFGQPDSQRCLTANGIQQAHLAGNWLSQYLGADNSIDLAIVSSFQRAKQTYQEVSHSIKSKREESSDDVIPNGDPKMVHDYLDSVIANDSALEYLLVVTHMPFICFLLEGITVDRCSMLFDTSSIAIVDYNVKTHKGKIEKVYHPQ